MNGIIIAFLITLIGAINIRFDLLDKGKYKLYWKGQVKNLKIGIIVAVVLAYFYMPALVWPDVLIPIFILLFINAVSNLVPFKGEIQETKTKQPQQMNKFAIGAIVFIIAIWILTPIYPLTQTEVLNTIPNATVRSEQISTIDPTHIRQVPLEFASWQADKVVGELGNRVVVGSLTIQLVNDHLYWVAPLELGNFFKWLKFKTSPGYVIVDAEKPDTVERVDDLNLEYLPSAFFHKNIRRLVYQKYPFYRLDEITFELDEERNPKWTISLVKPSIWFTGEKVVGLVIVDPETGEVEKFYKIPKWVDRVVPEKIAEKYNYWQGAYIHGFWNTKFSQRDMHVPTKKFGMVDVFAVRANDKLVWFTGHTSPSSKDQSMTGYATIDTRTGEFIYYSNVSGYYNENAALSNANSKVSNFEGYRGAQPVFYNLFGQLTWVVPILSSNYKLQRIALVHAKTGNVVISEKLEDALNQYQKWIKEEIGDVVGEKVGNELIVLEGVVERIKENYLVLMNRSDYIFELDPKNYEVLITEKGDKIKISYYTTNGSIAVVEWFDNLEFDFS